MKYYLVVIVALLYSYQSFSQDSTLKMRTEIGRIKEKADTSRFTPDIKSGWSLFGSYMAMTGKDSVVLEAAISHARDIDWKNYQLFGRIKDKSMIPGADQEIKYYLLNDGYLIKVDTQGYAYIRLADGQLPGGDPIVLPIKITFKGR
ncbi:MAG: hypothetical protein QM763_00850 [Agriterribacter sp.]